MDSLKKSMKWDEDVYGLEYDLVRGEMETDCLEFPGRTFLGMKVERGGGVRECGSAIRMRMCMAWSMT